MLSQLLPIFFNVISPVFGLVLIGYLFSKPLGLESRTLSRYAYYILVPAFVFNTISQADLKGDVLLRMIGYTLLIQIVGALLAFGLAKLLKRSAEMVAAYILVMSFANVGNFGLPIIEFRLGPAALADATIYFLIILTSGFIIGVAAANWVKGGSATAMLEVLKTPALIALGPALLVNVFDIPLPLLIFRLTELLGKAMVPTMLVTLGVQLSLIKGLRFNRDVIIVSLLRLVGGALLAIVLASPFNLPELTRNTGIIQASMPAAVLTSLIALEHGLKPDFVTTSVLFSTLLSVITLTLLMAWL
ncbi:MAG: AEC family transporter [Deinococcales bacterium]